MFKCQAQDSFYGNSDIMGFHISALGCLGGLYGLKFGRFLHAILYLPNEEVLIAILGYWMVCMALESNFRGDLDSDIKIA